MTFFFFVFGLILTCFAAYNPVPEPDEYILSYPQQDNPLNITVIEPFSKNYWILIGDWGASDETDQHVQKGVATKMKSYYKQQAADGYNLLGVITVGDNFYMEGKDCKHIYFEDHWRKIYGKELTNSNIAWLAIYGNHDWSNKDEYAMCAWKNPKFIDPKTKIPYNAKQLNAEKGGCNPSNYYIPDFGYVYSINALNFELIAMEQSYTDCPNGIGGSPHGKVYENCNGTQIGCNYLSKIAKASQEMMLERAMNSRNKNFLLIQHFPSVGAKLLNEFKTKRAEDGSHSDDTVWMAYGHEHIQECNRLDENGNCELILTGGGGGCCNEMTLRGFYVIGYDDEKNMIQPMNVSDKRLTCQYPCNEDPIPHVLEVCIFLNIFLQF